MPLPMPCPPELSFKPPGRMLGNTARMAIMYRFTSGAIACILIAVTPKLTPDVLADQAGPLRISGPVSVETALALGHDSDRETVEDRLPFPAFQAKPPASSPHTLVNAESPLPSEVAEFTPSEEASHPDTSRVPASEPVLSAFDSVAGSASEPEPIQSFAKPEREHLPLGQAAAAVRSEANGPASQHSGMSGIARTVGATALVIGLILLLRFAFVKLSGATGGLRSQLGPSGKAPSGVLFVLGRYPVSRGMSLVLLQLDQRVLLLSQTSSGFHTLAELSDPDEVTSIIRKARDENGDSLSAKFTGMLKKFESDPETIEDLDASAEARPVRLRFDGHDEQFIDSDGAASHGYFEPKPARTVSTGEDELRSRINRLREYGS